MFLKKGEILPDERRGERGGKKYVRFFVHEEQVRDGMSAKMYGSV
jgi:hypothetical protein